MANRREETRNDKKSFNRKKVGHRFVHKWWRNNWSTDWKLFKRTSTDRRKKNNKLTDKYEVVYRDKGVRVWVSVRGSRVGKSLVWRKSVASNVAIVSYRSECVWPRAPNQLALTAKIVRKDPQNHFVFTVAVVIFKYTLWLHFWHKHNLNTDKTVERVILRRLYPQTVRRTNKWVGGFIDVWVWMSYLLDISSGILFRVGFSRDAAAAITRWSGSHLEEMWRTRMPWSEDN